MGVSEETYPDLARSVSGCHRGPPRDSTSKTMICATVIGLFAILSLAGAYVERRTARLTEMFKTVSQYPE